MQLSRHLDILRGNISGQTVILFLQLKWFLTRKVLQTQNAFQLIYSVQFFCLLDLIGGSQDSVNSSELDPFLSR